MTPLRNSVGIKTTSAAIRIERVSRALQATAPRIRRAGARELKCRVPAAATGFRRAMASGSTRRRLRSGSAVMAVSSDAEGKEAEPRVQSEAQDSEGGVYQDDDGSEDPIPAMVSTMKILQFVLPTLGIWITNPMLSLVDTAIVGQSSAVELAALGPGVLLCDHSAYVFNFLAFATTNLLALAFSKDDKDQAEQVLSESLMAALGIGILSGAVYLIFAPECISLMAGSGGAALVPAASVYVRIRALGLVAALVSSVLQSFFLAARNPVTPMLSVMFAGLLNLIGDLVLCNGLGMGIAGAAWATVAAQFATCGLLLSAALRKQPEYAGSPVSGWDLRLRAFVPSPAVILRLLRFAGPVGLVLLIKVTMYTILNGFASGVGSVGTGAHHIAFSVFIFFAVFGDAVSMAGQSFLPPTIGRPRAKPESLAKRLLATSFVVGSANSLMSAVILFYAAGVFATSGDVLATVATLVPFVCAGLFIHCLSMSTEGIMLAGRKYTYLVWTYAANSVVVFLAFQAALAVGLSQLQAVWTGIITFQSVRLVTNFLTLGSPYSVLKSTQPLKGNM